MARRDTLFGRLRPAPAGPAVPGLISALQAYGGLQAWAARAHRPSQSLGRIGALEVRLAQTAAEVRQAQKLRFRVFYQEGAAIANPGRLFARRDVDAYDAICDHLLVLDHETRDKHNANRPAVVGTYRLLRQPVAEEYGGFYTSGEFDIGALIARHANTQFLELGRSCVLPPYRNKRTMELLWHGISGYIRQNRTDVMFGWLFGLAWLALLITVHRILLRLDRRDRIVAEHGGVPDQPPSTAIEPDAPTEEPAAEEPSTRGKDRP